MPATDHPCTWRRAPTLAGDRRPATWLSMHDRVVVITTDGQRIEGRPTGALWYGFQEPYSQGFQVELDDGSSWAALLPDIESITPLKTLDPQEIIDSVTHAIRHPHTLQEEGGEGYELIVDEHTTVEIEVVIRRKECTPSSSPHPRFAIVVDR